MAQRNGNAYYISDAGGDYLSGVALAEENGGHMVTIESEQENEFVFSLLSDFGGASNHLWLGLDDVDGDGVYNWVTGEPLNYTNFSTEPDAGKAIEMTTPDGDWMAAPINDDQDYRRYMLEIEGDSEPSEALLCGVESFSVQAGDGENILSWEEPGVCHDYVIDQIPFYTTGNNEDTGDNWIVSGSQGDDVAYKLKCF